MTRYAVVDLEATDAHSSQKKIIQIGIVIIEENQIVATYATDVNPHEGLTEKIRELTGLSNTRLRRAPDFTAVAKKVAQLLKDSVFVAHNAAFDYNLLADTFAGAGLEFPEMMRVDTVELTRIFYPTFEKYGLEALDDLLELTHDRPHAALSDAYATAELLLKIQKKVQKLPRAVLEEILRHADSLLYESSSFLQEQLSATKLVPAGLQVVHNLATRLPVKKRGKRKALANEFSKNIKLLGLTARKRQAELAEQVLKDLDLAEPSFFEAPTGMGKTLAYLLPLLAQGKQVIVSTPTKVLQEQLVQEVGQRLQQKFAVKFTKLLGTRNYVSLEKLAQVLQVNTDGKNFEIFKMKVLVWLTETLSGELDELSTVMTNGDYFAAICHEGQVKQSDLHYEQDFWLRAQAEAAAAQVKVVNHAYLIERLADYPETFLGDAVLVVDEAQQLFPIMENLGQKSVKISEVMRPIDEEDAENVLHQRLRESLHYQLSKKDLDLDKIRLDAQELALSNLTEVLSNPTDFIWREGDVLRSSTRDFYDFARLVPADTKLYMLGASLSLTAEKPTFPELLGFGLYHFCKFAGEQASNQEMYIVTDAPNIKNTGVMDYADYLADQIAKLAEYNLPIVVLFTSKMSLTFTAERLSASGVELLAQDINGTAAQLKKKFDKGDCQILLGLGSFWEGVDFDKQERVILVLPRLPFATPDDILTKKYAKRFKNPFYDFNVPMATLKMQQAMGRVNRRRSQRSAVVVLDKRLAGKSYAKRMRRNLEELLPINLGTFDEDLGKILEFLL